MYLPLLWGSFSLIPLLIDSARDMDEEVGLCSLMLTGECFFFYPIWSRECRGHHHSQFMVEFIWYDVGYHPTCMCCSTFLFFCRWETSSIFLSQFTSDDPLVAATFLIMLINRWFSSCIPLLIGIILYEIIIIVCVSCNDYYFHLSSSTLWSTYLIMQFGNCMMRYVLHSVDELSWK